MFWTGFSPSVFSFLNRFWGKSSICNLYYSVFILLQMSPIGAGEEPFKKGSRDNLWEKERLCKQIMNPYRHSSEVKLCQLAVMGSSFVKSSGSMSLNTHTLFMAPLRGQPLFSNRRTNRGHRPTEVGFTNDSWHQWWVYRRVNFCNPPPPPLLWSAVKKPTTLARNQRLQTHGQTSS